MENALEVINLEVLVKRLNVARSLSEEKIEVRQDSITSPRGSRKVMTKGKYSLVQNFEAIGSIFDVLFSDDSEDNIGSISFERGFSEPESNYSPVYERVRVIINQPVKLKKGDVLPRCEVNLTVESDEFVEPSIYRQDYIPGFLYKKRTDLSKILPTEWFLS